MKNLITYSIIFIVALFYLACNQSKSKGGLTQEQSFEEQSSDKTETAKAEEQSSDKAEELISKQKPSLKIITHTLDEYLDKEIDVYGYCELDDYYNYEYINSQSTHYVIMVSDKRSYDKIKVYFIKNSKNKKLLDILDQRDPVPMKLKIIFLSSKNADSNGRLITNMGMPQFEGLSWEVIDNNLSEKRRVNDPPEKTQTQVNPIKTQNASPEPTRKTTTSEERPMYTSDGRLITYIGNTNKIFSVGPLPTKTTTKSHFNIDDNNSILKYLQGTWVADGYPRETGAWIHEKIVFKGNQVQYWLSYGEGKTNYNLGSPKTGTISIRDETENHENYQGKIMVLDVGDNKIVAAIFKYNNGKIEINDVYKVPWRKTY